MTAVYYESHAHYDDPRFNGDREELLSRLLPEAGVGRVVNVGADMASSKASIRLAEAYPYVFAAVGVHPHSAKEAREADYEALLGLAAHPRVVALGEMGLDYHYNHSEPEVQRQCFRRQLGLVKEAGLPVIIHSREAAADTLDILTESGVKRGVIHCFGYDVEMAMAFVSLGFYIAFGGAVTFPKTAKLAEAVAAVPLDRLLIETDSPYIAPVPIRGQRNDSRNLSYICQRIAEIRGITHEQAAEAAWANGSALFAR